MTRRVHFTPLLAASVFSLGLLGVAARRADAVEVPFGPQNTVSATADGARSVFAADVDGDGDIDVLAASLFDNSVAWYENDGSQNFTPHIITTRADVVASVFATDVDGDGDGDTDVLATISFGVAWYENDGSQNFTTHTITTLGNGTRSVFAADVDGDGDTDVLSGSEGDDKVAWYENTAPLFTDGFESGDTSAWSSSVP